MAKSSNKTIVRNPSKANLVKKTAEICNVSQSLVYQVLRMDRQNEEIISTYMFLLQGENALVEAAKKLVPFN